MVVVNIEQQGTLRLSWQGSSLGNPDHHFSLAQNDRMFKTFILLFQLYFGEHNFGFGDFGLSEDLYQFGTSIW